MIDINKAKQKILDLAIRGKFTKQLKSDGNAADLLVEIQKEKEKLINDKKIRNDANVISDGIEEPFEIPENWMWCKQEDVCMLYNGILSDNKELLYLEARVIRGQKEPLIINKGIKVDKDEYIILVDEENSGEIMKVPYNRYMGSTFKILLFYKREISDFVKFNIDLEKQELKDNKTGSAIPHLNKKIFRERLIPLPPHAEQKRISNRIEELLNSINF